MLTGHGCFRKRFCDMKLRQRKKRDCGRSEQPRGYVLRDRPLYNGISKIMDALEYAVERLIHFADMTSGENQEKFQRTQKVSPEMTFIEKY
ncbi:hypothetical protein EVAR_72067_1 [Eumeta japonica]|uniref:Uncharacterized protein n=1 Tax=Eumeta variegata TaxID=151549 RepID=A0A4C2A7E7_EUMVA|nr:hypothetical protein EVAR_72067_1 [Eumeta japonica]